MGKEIELSWSQSSCYWHHSLKRLLGARRDLWYFFHLPEFVFYLFWLLIKYSPAIWFVMEKTAFCWRGCRTHLNFSHWLHCHLNTTTSYMEFLIPNWYKETVTPAGNLSNCLLAETQMWREGRKGCGYHGNESGIGGGFSTFVISLSKRSCSLSSLFLEMRVVLNWSHPILKSGLWSGLYRTCDYQPALPICN